MGGQSGFRLQNTIAGISARYDRVCSAPHCLRSMAEERMPKSRHSRDLVNAKWDGWFVGRSGQSLVRWVGWFSGHSLQESACLVCVLIWLFGGQKWPPRTGIEIELPPSPPVNRKKLRKCAAASISGTPLLTISLTILGASHSRLGGHASEESCDFYWSVLVASTQDFLRDFK